MIYYQALFASFALATTFDVVAGAQKGLKTEGRRLRNKGPKRWTKKSKKPTPFYGSTDCITADDAFAAIEKFAGAVPAVQAGADCVESGGIGLDYIDEAYAVNAGGGLLFKPTVSSSPNTFRNGRLDAASYFVGTECMWSNGLQYPPDNNVVADPTSRGDVNFFELGFGTSNGIVDYSFPIEWEYLTSENNPAYCGVVVAAGQICFLKSNGDDNSCVDKTFTIIRGDADAGQDDFVISSHHSSKVVDHDVPTQTQCQVEFDPAMTDLPVVEVPTCS